MKLILGDCVEVMAGMDPESVDAVVTDPPAAINFKSLGWDSDLGGLESWVGWLAVVMRGCLRVSKPGAYAAVWALPRTSYWTGLALHQAGWEIKDVITHVFSSGFSEELRVL